MRLINSTSESQHRYAHLQHPFIEENTNTVLNKILRLQIDGYLSPFLLNNYLKTQYWREECERKRA
jgi:hypothetical protein